MKITATTIRLRVDYKLNGKKYDPAAASEGQPDINNATYSTYPFDSQDVEVGEYFEVNGAEVVRVVEYTAHAEQGEASVAP